MNVRLGAFELVERLGRGAVGEVWRAVDTRAADGVDVAVKLVTSARALDPLCQRTLRNEMRSLGALCHPGVTALLDYGEVDADAASHDLVEGSPYIVMELAHGTLRRESENILTYGSLKVFLLQMLDALAHAHARGVIHRDIKPMNVLVRDDDAHRYKLADFGVAHVVRASSRADERASGSGTPRYMAPEQVRGELREQGPWTDLYALGCVAFWLVTGHPPFVGDVAHVLRAHIEDEPPPLVPRFGIPDSLRDWVFTLLAKHPDDRFRCAADAAHELERLPPPANTGPIVSVPAADAAPDDATFVFADTSWTQHAHESPLRRARPKARPMPTSWRAAAVARVAPAAHHRHRPRVFVGRDRERDALWSQLCDTARDARPRLAVVRGPIGVGKSELVGWLTERGRELGAVTVMRARHDAMTGSHQALADMVGTHARAAGLDRGQLVERLARTLSDHGRATSFNLYDVATLADMVTGSAALRALAEQRRAVIRYVATVARERPVLLWIDNAARAAAALRLVRELLDEDVPVLMVATARDEELAARPEESELFAALSSHERATVLTLSALSDDEQQVAIAALAPLNDQVAEALAHHTAGNPLFAVEIVRDWRSRGRLTDLSKTPPMPASLEELFVARVLHALEGEQDAREHAQSVEIAATLGDEIALSEWTAACRLRGLRARARALDALVSRDLLSWRRDDGGVERWRFAHVLLRESILRHARAAGRWADHHRACAAMLEADNHVGAAGRIAAHRLAAGDDALALAPLLVEAENTARRGEFDAAHRVDERRAAALDRLNVAPDAESRVLGWLRSARTYLLQGELARGRELIERASGAVTSASSAAVRAELAWSELVMARYDGAIETGKRSAAAAMAAYREIHDAIGVARCNKKLGELCRVSGELDASERHYREALGEFEKRDDLFEIAWTCMGICATGKQRGDFDVAERYARIGLERFERLGASLGVGHANNELGEIERFRERFADAELCYRRALDAWRDHRHVDLDLVRLNIALAQLGAGNLSRAQTTMQELLERARSGRRGLAMYVLAGLVDCYARTGDWDACRVSLDELLAHLEATELVDLDIAKPLERAGTLAETAGRDDIAGRALAVAQRQLDKLGG